MSVSQSENPAWHLPQSANTPPLVEFDTEKLAYQITSVGGGVDLKAFLNNSWTDGEVYIRTETDELIRLGLSYGGVSIMKCVDSEGRWNTLQTSRGAEYFYSRLLEIGSPFIYGDNGETTSPFKKYLSVMEAILIQKIL